MAPPMAVFISSLLNAQQKQKIAAAKNKIEPLVLNGEEHFIDMLNSKTVNSIPSNCFRRIGKLGIEVKEGIAKIGVTAVLRVATKGPFVALLPNMDPLTVIERVALSLASKEQ